MEVGPGSASAAGRKVVDVLDAWIDQNPDTWAPSSARDQQSRVRSIEQDKVAEISIAQLSIADVERWHTRLRGVARLVLESRQDDRDDERVIMRTREREPSLVFEHRIARPERMLWIADAVTWAVGSGAQWSDRLGDVLIDVIEVHP